MVGVERAWGDAFPFGTLVVNTVGSFFLGGLLGAGLGEGVEDLLTQPVFVFLGVGFCGGLTTFSTFSLQTITLVSQQSWSKVALNIGGSLIVCLLALVGGYALAERLAG